MAYNWMGGATGAPLVDQLNVTYTSTRSIFTFSVAGKVTLNVEFLSPVYPTDLKRQSIPFSYLIVKARSLDGASHSVQVYSDVSGGEQKLKPPSSGCGTRFALTLYAGRVCLGR